MKSRRNAEPDNEHPEICQSLTPIQRQVLSPAKTCKVQFQHAGRGRTALRYLARYVRRSAFAAKRLIGYDK